MERKDLLKISRSCAQLEQHAQKLYGHFASAVSEKPLIDFWNDISEDEGIHLAFWEFLIELLESNDIYSIPDIKDNTLLELQEANIKAEKLMDKVGKDMKLDLIFKHAFEIEFLMLHPAFELLFHYTALYTGQVTPEENYEQHISKFVNMAKKYSAVDRDILMISDMLLSLWKRNKTLAFQSSMDILTNILNRRGLFSSIFMMANLAHRSKFNIAFMMIDIDDFKKVNDNYGHKVGDEVLQKVAGIIKQNLRTSDIVGRYGGEEFLAFLSNIDQDSLYTIAEKIRKAVINEHGFEFPVTVSIGASQGQLSTNIKQEVDSLIKESDDYLYEAKNFGKNRVALDYLGDKNTKRL